MSLACDLRCELARTGTSIQRPLTEVKWYSRVAILVINGPDVRRKLRQKKDKSIAISFIRFYCQMTR